ncbi:MAG: hypothetical protein GWP09_01460 [Nitrospiraceae bacterium]|nr:hypothetical protein [Nitrospiraceae bacterium]
MLKMSIITSNITNITGLSSAYGINLDVFYLLIIGLLLFIGILISIFSAKIKTSDIIFLILAGVGIGYTHIVSFPPIFLTSLAILALAMIVFDATSRLKLKEIDTLSMKGIKLALLFASFVMLFLTPFIMLIDYHYRGIYGLFLAFLFTSIMTGTSPSVVMSMMKEGKKKAVRLLEIESIINTPLTVIIPTIILDLFMSLNMHTSNHSVALSGMPFFLDITKAFFMKIIVGFGTGLFLGLIIFKFMRNTYSKVISPLVTITTAILAYGIAEALGGNGVLSVTTLGVMFGNIYVKSKMSLQEYSQTFSSILRILVFMLIGIASSLPLNWIFWLRALLIFTFYTIIRGITIAIIFKNSNLKPQEKLFMTLNGPKGIAVVVVTFSLYTYSSIIGMIGNSLWQYNINMIIGFTIISILVSTLATRFKNIILTDDTGIVDTSKTQKMPHIDEGYIAMRNYSKNKKQKSENNNINSYESNNKNNNNKSLDSSINNDKSSKTTKTVM